MRLSLATQTKLTDSRVEPQRPPLSHDTTTMLSVDRNDVIVLDSLPGFTTPVGVPVKQNHNAIRFLFCTPEWGAGMSRQKNVIEV
jgi:hypothetical protein